MDLVELKSQFFLLNSMKEKEQSQSMIKDASMEIGVLGLACLQNLLHHLPSSEPTIRVSLVRWSHY